MPVLLAPCFGREARGSETLMGHLLSYCVALPSWKGSLPGRPSLETVIEFSPEIRSTKSSLKPWGIFPFAIKSSETPSFERILERFGERTLTISSPALSCAYRVLKIFALWFLMIPR